MMNNICLEWGYGWLPYVTFLTRAVPWRIPQILSLGCGYRQILSTPDLGPYSVRFWCMRCYVSHPYDLSLTSKHLHNNCASRFWSVGSSATLDLRLGYNWIVGVVLISTKSGWSCNSYGLLCRCCASTKPDIYLFYCSCPKASSDFGPSRNDTIAL